ncbi:MAG TPA: isoleucine--tRNA ligase, partial [Coxiellaceae bacterium]|nr:isoleucine--tRNA ligase [Coxiellaceae bacterium]
TCTREGDAPRCCSFVIWTTTPWTLPANEAISVNEEFEYALVQAGDRYFVLANALVAAAMTRYGIHHYKILSTVPGKKLEKLFVQHPFLDRQVPILLGEHVTIEAGTGAVHTAPAHGQEDYVIGQRYGLPMVNPVNAKSCFNEDVPQFAGLHVFKANEPIIAALKASGHLLHQAEIQHSYPHCWRHKTPLIFRATPQWFISMTQKKLRDVALKTIPTVQWIPSWGEQRITKMIEARPDWCISRQRTWGIPITLFVHQKTGELHPNTIHIMQQAANLIEKKGIDAWFDTDSSDFIDDAADYVKVNDVLDVWFDSGVTHACVLAIRPELYVPADLYLEGSDQHRGWFQTSLLTSLAIRNRAPFKAVLTHGYVVDGQGRKMSKSIGNTILPADVVKKDGADVLRLWALATDHTGDISVSDEILKRSGDAYRRIRNTMRFLLSNLFDFDPAKNLVAPDQLVLLDAWMMTRVQALQKNIVDAFNTYQFSFIYQTIHNFCTVELGGFYLDVIKDRQYTSAKNSVARRSAQTAIYYLCEAMVRWLAPIVTFTADEIWTYMPGKREQSVFLAQWFSDFPIIQKIDFPWEALIKIRTDANKLLEAYRADGRIGSALDAELVLHVSADEYDTLKKFENELRFFFIVSDVRVEKNADAETKIDIIVSTHQKCARCWQRRADVGIDKKHDTICARCIENVDGEGETRLFA